MTPPEYLCPNNPSPCDSVTACLTEGCRRSLLPPIGRLHFVGFRDERYYAAVRAFGPPDFVHRRWDARAAAEIGPDDVAVFAVGDEHSPLNPYTYDDSAAPDDPATRERHR